MDKDVFWDKKLNKEDAKRILKNENHPRFIETAALLLSRTNRVDIVFKTYINKVVFCRNWSAVKRRMRDNKWSDKRIKYWQAIYEAARKTVKHSLLKKMRRKRTPVSPEAERIGRIIREARKKMEWTQGDLAEKIDLSQQIISFAENGYLNFSFETLLKITRGLNLKVSIYPARDKITYTVETDSIDAP